MDLSIVGEYFAKTEQVITEYADSTNYEYEFEEMNEPLREINENIKNQDTELESEETELG